MGIMEKNLETTIMGLGVDGIQELVDSRTYNSMPCRGTTR